MQYFHRATKTRRGVLSQHQCCFTFRFASLKFLTSSRTSQCWDSEKISTGDTTHVPIKCCGLGPYRSAGGGWRGTGSGPAHSLPRHSTHWPGLGQGSLELHVVHLSQLGVAAQGHSETLGWGLERHPQILTKPHDGSIVKYHYKFVFFHGQKF